MHIVEGITSSQLSLVSYKGIYTGRALIMFPVTGFPSWKYVASFLAPVKLSVFLQVI